MKGAARAGKPPTSGRRKQRRGRVAPAELARLCSLPGDHPQSLLRHGFSQKHIDDEAKRLRRLHASLYGRVVFPLREPGEAHAPPAGGNAGGACCSHAWADEVWRSYPGQVPYPPRPDRGNPRPQLPILNVGLRLLGQRPPPMPRAMRPCPACGAEVPPIYFNAGVCHDCHHEADDGRSIGAQRSGSVIGMRELRER